MLVVVLLAALSARSSPAAAQIDSCSDCHDVELAEGAVHEIFGCADCHSDVVDFPHAEDLLLGDQVCAQCHDAGEALDGSVHAGIADCQSCHGAAHEILPVSAAASPASQRQQMTTCGQCHEDELIQAFTGSVHGEALLKSGLASAPSCSGCHGAHDILSAADPGSRVSPPQVPDTCGDCHVYILEEWRELSAHGLAWQAGDETAPVCNTCHSSHEVAEPGTAEARLGVPGICGECHGGRFESYRDGFHGQVSSLGFVTAANCADCHTPHQNLAADDPRSSIHPDNLAETCGQCHGDVNAAFLSYDPHSDPTDPERNAAVYYIWLFMTSLLLGVFGFFSHPELTKESGHNASGNWAYLDQVAALQWIQRNIAQFGGDPAKVVISGQSAGAVFPVRDLPVSRVESPPFAAVTDVVELPRTGARASSSSTSASATCPASCSTSPSPPRCSTRASSRRATPSTARRCAASRRSRNRTCSCSRIRTPR